MLFNQTTTAPGGRYGKGIVIGLPFAEDDTVERYVTSSFAENGKVTLSDGTIIQRPHPHTGLDVHAGSWVELHAMAAGRAKHVGRSQWGTGASGYYVVIDHGNGVETWYLHMIELQEEGAAPVSVGDTINQGQHIGWADATGSPTQGSSFIAHLHLGVRVNGVFVDPFLAIDTLLVEPAPPVIVPDDGTAELDEETFIEYFASAYYLEGAPHMGTRAISPPRFIGYAEGRVGEEIWSFILKRPVAERPD